MFFDGAQDMSGYKDTKSCHRTQGVWHLSIQIYSEKWRLLVRAMRTDLGCFRQKSFIRPFDTFQPCLKGKRTNCYKNNKTKQPKVGFFIQCFCENLVKNGHWFLLQSVLCWYQQMNIVRMKTIRNIPFPDGRPTRKGRLYSEQLGETDR